MRVFVTGAAGPLGRALTAALTRRGDTVRGSVRRKSGVAVMRQLGAEAVLADVSRESPLANAMQGCDLVFHVAQFFDFWAPSESMFEAVNVGGAKNTLTAAVAAKVPRVIFCSSSVTIGEEPGTRGNEGTRHRGYTLTAFERSELDAERAALGFRRRGVEVVVVNPGLIVAPGDRGWTGRMISSCVAGGRPLAPDTPVGWLSVADAANGLLAAAEHGVDGERYILSGDTLTLRDFLSLVARYAGQSPPRNLSKAFALTRARLATAIASASGRRPSLSLDEARFATTGFRVDGTRAEYELGVEYTPMSRYLPSLVRSYQVAQSHFAGWQPGA